MLRYMHAYIKKPSTPTSEAASLGVENGEGLPRSWAAGGAAAVSVGAALGHRSRSGHECHVSRVTRLQLRVFVTTVVLMLSRAWSRVRAARREAAERAVARARSWLQPSPAQPSPAQHHTWAGARDMDAGGGGGGHGGAAPVTLLCRGCYRCNASYPLIIAFTLVAYRYTRY